METKKKKERRKENDSAAVETSDEEANSSQGKNSFVSIKLGHLYSDRKIIVHISIN